jgi:hypothetical protein
MSDRLPEPVLEDAFEHRVRERASATPVVRLVHAARTTATPAIATPTLLRDVQTWMCDAITRPLDEGDTRDAEGVVTASARLSANDRLDLYRWGYHARLVECLADDYPALQHFLGEPEFEAMCHRYIAAHPSRSPSLNAFGRQMPEFARTAPFGAFASELARLEWALVEMIHAPPAPVLVLEELQAIAPEAWARARLPPSETVRVLRFEHAVNRYLQAFRDGDAPSVPEARASATAVYRRGFVVWRMDLTPSMTGLLDALFAGATLGDALATLARHAEDRDALEESERNVMVWFREWVAGGFFARIEIER